MAGRNQHYIPQSLLRGFEAQSSGKEVQVWVFHAERPPYLTTTRNVAAERDFYSEPSPLEKTLDDAITLYENADFQKLIDQMRKTQPGEAISSSHPAEVISHLVFRGAHLRETLLDAIQNFAHEFLMQFSDEDKSRSYLGLDNSELEATLAEELEKIVEHLKNFANKRIPTSLIERLCRFKLREEFSLHWPQLAKNLNYAVNEFSEKSPNLIKEAHRNALSTLEASRFIIDELCQLKWVLIRKPRSTFVLPDCIAIARSKDVDDYQPLLFCDRQILRDVLFPISSELLLVGKHDHLANDLDPIIFNTAAASCSFKFFVAANKSSSIEFLSTSIGSKCNGFTQEISRDVFKPKVDLYASQQVATEIINNDVFNFPMHLEGMTSEAEAYQVVDAFNSVYRSIRARYSLSIIDEVWFAADYESTLKQLNFGSDSSPIESNANGVGLAPIVIRNGKVKCCLVLRNWIGIGLLKPPTEEAFRISLYVVSKMLMRIALVELIDRQLPRFIYRDSFDARIHYHYQPVSNAFSSYFSERFSARFCLENDQSHLDAYKNAVARASQVIPKARLTYRVDGDLNSLLIIALSSIASILDTAAAIIGYGDAVESDDLLALCTQTEQLKSLQSWLSIFRRDLRYSFNQISCLNSYTQLEQLSIHTERLLWEFGIFSWQMDSGEMYFEIPVESDVIALTNRPTQP